MAGYGDGIGGGAGEGRLVPCTGVVIWEREREGRNDWEFSVEREEKSGEAPSPFSSGGQELVFGCGPPRG